MEGGHTTHAEKKLHRSVRRRNDTSGIGTGIFYPAPVHMFPHIVEAAGVFELPVAEILSREVISIPVHLKVSEADIDRIVEEVNRL